jgi:hypothetical protein
MPGLSANYTPSNAQAMESQKSEVRGYKEQLQELSTLALTSVEVPAGIFELPLPENQGEWSVPQKLYDELRLAYPDIGIMGELSKMRIWLLANSSKRKTANGLPRFINNWLAKAQNSPRTTGGNPYGKPYKTQQVIDVTERLNERYRLEAEREAMGQQPDSGGRTLEAWTTPERAGAGHDGQPVAQDALGDW